MNSPTATLDTPTARATPAAPSISAKRPLKIALADYHSSETFLIVQGRSSKEYRFDYSKSLQRFIFETASQEDVDDLFRANGMYGFFSFSALVEDAPSSDAEIARLTGLLDESSQGQLRAAKEAEALRTELLETNAKLNEAKRELAKARPAKANNPPPK